MKNLALVIAFILAAIALAQTAALTHKVERLEHIACAVRQYEDGSVSLEDRDNVRFACMKKHP